MVYSCFKKAGLANLGTSSLCERAVFKLYKSRRRSNGGHFLYILLTSTLGPKVRLCYFLLSLNTGTGSLLIPSRSEARVLNMDIPMSIADIHSGIH